MVHFNQRQQQGSIEFSHQQKHINVLEMIYLSIKNTVNSGWNHNSWHPVDGKENDQKSDNKKKKQSLEDQVGNVHTLMECNYEW